MIKLNRNPCPNPEGLKTNYKLPENKKALMASSYGKCMYCESSILHIDYGDVEHIKPKSTYPDDKYNWENLGIACVKCNRDNKKTHYDNDFINPFEEEPEDNIKAAPILIIAKNGSQKGQITIDILGLNRADLLEKRSTEIKKMQDLIIRYYSLINPTQKSALLNEIRVEAGHNKEYSLSKKALIDENGL